MIINNDVIDKAIMRSAELDELDKNSSPFDKVNHGKSFLCNLTISDTSHWFMRIEKSDTSDILLKRYVPGVQSEYYSENYLNNLRPGLVISEMFIILDGEMFTERDYIITRSKIDKDLYLIEVEIKKL